MLTSRELVHCTLAFANPPRAPRDLWALPIALDQHRAAYDALLRDFPMDFQGIDGHRRVPLPTRGDWYAVGEYVDPWGCTFVNIQRGVIGEVKDPLVKDWAADRARIHVPREALSIDRDAINRDCAATTKFCLGGALPRPFEQLQFLRGSAELLMDLRIPPGLRAFLGEMHELYCAELRAWAQTDVDALLFMDDWGSQQALLISPPMWREYFKPLYRDYAQIAHGAGKKIFMHSDGHIRAIYPDLLEIGIDALNSQLFCMGVETLTAFAGRITFWGEIDRQHLLPHGTRAEIRAAVRAVHRQLWRQGGCFAQCEFGAGANPVNVRAVYETWEELAAC